ncbi:MAG TPA: PAS domain S-box protein [Azospirillaceae bacterium]|nr:PAS domain S-box protein [Azospirillaceae bacterium]
MTRTPDRQKAPRGTLRSRTRALCRLIRMLGAAGRLADRVRLKREADEAQARLRASEARLKAIVDTAVDAIVVIDERGVIQSANPAVARLFGYEPGELVGRNVSMLMPQPDRTSHDSYLSRYGKTGERRIIGIGREVRGCRRDGTTFPLELSIAEWNEKGRRYFTGIMRDVSARRRAEEDLTAAKDEAERANLSKTKFLAAASHDLRQPLQSMFLLSAALARHVAEPGRELLVHMERGLEAQKEMLDGLLDVSKLEAGAVKPEIQEFPIDGLLDQIDSAYAIQAAGKGLEWSVTRCSAKVRSDPALLNRLVRNLVENAVRYTAAGRVRLRCQVEGGVARLIVEDTGIGIPADHLGRIWDEFHQVGNAERDRSQGLGLGLAIVRRLAKLLGHEVRVESVPGQGSRFTVEVPALAPAAATKPVLPAGAVARLDGTGQAVVLIDDDAIVLMGLQAMFRDWGYTVMAAGSGEQAAELVARAGRRPDLIVSDYRLKRGEIGTDAVRAVRATAGGDIPAILLTGESSLDSQRDAEAEGMQVIHKPVTPRQLVAALRRQEPARPGTAA